MCGRRCDKVSAEPNELEAGSLFGGPRGYDGGFDDTPGGCGVAGDAVKFKSLNQVKGQRELALDHGGSGRARQNGLKNVLADHRYVFRIGVGGHGGERFVDDLAAEGFGFGALGRGPGGRRVVAQV